MSGSLGKQHVTVVVYHDDVEHHRLVEYRVVYAKKDGTFEVNHFAGGRRPVKCVAVGMFLQEFRVRSLRSAKVA